MTREGQSALVADGVYINIGERTIIHDCSLKIDRGEFVGIIGPNGAGKSTLLKGLRGLLPVASGQVSVYGHPIHRLGDKKAARLVAFMQQEVNVGFGFTALEVVMAGRYPYMKWWQNEGADDRHIAKQYMAFTGIEALADKPVNQVSGGERQRILLAKVLTQETPLIFLDEPTASLDLVFQEETFRYCQAVCKEGKSVLIIAHDIKLAAKFCSRLVLLAEGRVVADGAPEDVITADNLEKAYGLHSAVFLNKVTGNLDIHTFAATRKADRPLAVHIIGGGGTTGDIMRSLHERGYRLTAGVLQAGDTDADVADAFGVEFVAGQAFSEITERQAEENRGKIACADLTVLGNLCYGKQNLDNLRAAFVAPRLVVIEDTPVDGRDFTGGEAAVFYRDLVRQRQVTVMTSTQFLAKIESHSVC
ncbi:MAG TPA: ABC transporter ATP-binding protein [Negativicutes bacterium]|nr:ABC transporter ATP-binding protein [Negativicutes bacterium]